MNKKTDALEAIEKRLEGLRIEQESINQELNSLYIKRQEEHFGIRQGQKVLWKGNPAVVDYEPTPHGCFHFRLRKVNKSGKVSENHRYIYSSDVEEVHNQILIVQDAV